MAVRYTKYYESLFLGLVDIALVNIYIVHREYHRQNFTTQLTHIAFLKRLHIELTQLTEENLTGNSMFARPEFTVQGSAAFEDHRPKQLEEWRNSLEQNKRRQRSCKVCSMLRERRQEARMINNVLLWRLQSRRIERLPLRPCTALVLR